MLHKKYSLSLLALLISFACLKADGLKKEQLYYGDVSNNFVIRWAYQNFCDFVFEDKHPGRFPTVKNKTLSFNPERVQPGSVIFVRDTWRFYKELHPRIKHPYIIITAGDAGNSMNDNCFPLLNDKKVIAWFGIHPNREAQIHPKFFPIPLGILQAKEHYKNRGQLHHYFKHLRETVEKKHAVYLNFGGDNRADRGYVRNLFKNKSYVKLGKKAPFKNYLRDMAGCTFTLSPEGNGVDSYRTWECLLVGSIPIVKNNTLVSLYEGLPVVIVNTWEEVTEDFLRNKYKEITSKQYDLKRLYCEYWFSKIVSVRELYFESIKNVSEKK